MDFFLHFNSHSDSFYFIVPSYKESPICLILLPELDRCNDQTFVSFLITVWKTAAKDRSLALLVLHYSYPSTFSQSFLPFFPNPTTTVAWHPYQMNWGKKEAGAASHQAKSNPKVQFQLVSFIRFSNVIAIPRKNEICSDDVGLVLTNVINSLN